MSDFLKLLAFGATAVAAVAVAKEVIDRAERGEDCSPVAVIKGIGKKIASFCGCERCKDSDDGLNLNDIDDFDLLEEDDDDDTPDAEGGDSDGEEFVQLEIEIEPAVDAQPEETAKPEEAVESEDDAVDEALKSVAASFDDGSHSDGENDAPDAENEND